MHAGVGVVQLTNWKEEYQKCGFVDLEEELRQSGFDYLPNFVHYGRVVLRSDLEAANRKFNNAIPVDRPAIQPEVNAAIAAIERARAEIVPKTFFSTYSFSTNERDIRPRNDGLHSISLTIWTGDVNLSGTPIVWFPMSGIELDAPVSFGSQSIRLTVRGNPVNIRRLASDNHQAIIRFTGLSTSTRIGYMPDNISASVLALEIVRVGDAPRPEAMPIHTAAFGSFDVLASYALRPESKDIPFVGVFDFSPAQSDGNRILRINTRFTSSEADEVLFPDDLNVVGNVEVDDRGTALVLSLSGNADDIGGLISANYRARVWFKNLQRNNRTNHSADVQKIEIVRIR